MRSTANAYAESGVKLHPQIAPVVLSRHSSLHQTGLIKKLIRLIPSSLCGLCTSCATLDCLKSYPALTSTYPHLYLPSPLPTLTSTYPHHYLPSPLSTLSITYPHLYLPSPLPTLTTTYPHLYLPSPLPTLTSTYPHLYLPSPLSIITITCTYPHHYRLVEPLAEFKAAVVRSASVRKLRSSFKKHNTPSASSQGGLSRQTSHAATSESEPTFDRQASHHSQGNDEPQPTSGVADHFSLEDLPVIAHPSPNPGRRAISVGPDDEIPDEVEDELVSKMADLLCVLASQG